MPEPHWRELLGQRVLGYLNWRRNRHLIHRRDMLDVIVSDMQAQQPDHIAVTGDLVNLALDAEFRARAAGSKASAHRTRSRWYPAITTAMCAEHPNAFAETFGDYMRSDGTPDTRFPFLRIRELGWL